MLYQCIGTKTTTNLQLCYVKQDGMSRELGGGGATSLQFVAFLRFVNLDKKPILLRFAEVPILRHGLQRKHLKKVILRLK